MARRHRNSGRRAAAGRASTGTKPVKAGPTPMEQLVEAAREAEQHAHDHGGFVRKPRAVRKYEKFSSMGG